MKSLTNNTATHIKGKKDLKRGQKKMLTELTRQIPGLEFADINFTNNIHLVMTTIDLQAQIMIDKLLIRGPKTISNR